MNTATGYRQDTPHHSFAALQGKVLAKEGSEDERDARSFRVRQALFYVLLCALTRVFQIQLLPAGVQEDGWTLVAENAAEADSWKQALTSTVAELKTLSISGDEGAANGKGSESTPAKNSSAKAAETPKTGPAKDAPSQPAAAPDAPSASTVNRVIGEVASEEDQASCLVNVATVKNGDICLLLRSDSKWRYAKLDHRGGDNEMVFVVNDQGHHKIIPVEGQKDFVRKLKHQ
jgi:hypothetical protein